MTYCHENIVRFVAHPEPQLQLLHNHIPVLRSLSERGQHGKFHYEFDTQNGIHQHEGGIGGQSVRGGYTYTSPEGQLINVEYEADELGFRVLNIPKQHALQQKDNGWEIKYLPSSEVIPTIVKTTNDWPSW